MWVTLLILFTTAFHGVATEMVLRSARRLSFLTKRPLTRAFLVPLLVVAMLLVVIVEAGLWAYFYVRAELLGTFEEALYFSIVTMTTLGYGDITLVGAGRIAAGMQAAMGIVLFGWTTAVIFSVVELVHAPLRRSHPP